MLFKELQNHAGKIQRIQDETHVMIQVRWPMTEDTELISVINIIVQVLERLDIGNIHTKTIADEILRFPRYRAGIFIEASSITTSPGHLP